MADNSNLYQKFGAMIERLKTDSELDKITEEEIENYASVFSLPYKNKKIIQQQKTNEIDQVRVNESIAQKTPAKPEDTVEQEIEGDDNIALAEQANTEQDLKKEIQTPVNQSDQPPIEESDQEKESLQLEDDNSANNINTISDIDNTALDAEFEDVPSLDFEIPSVSNDQIIDPVSSQQSNDELINTTTITETATNQTTKDVNGDGSDSIDTPIPEELDTTSDALTQNEEGSPEEDHLIGKYTLESLARQQGIESPTQRGAQELPKKKENISEQILQEKALPEKNQDIFLKNNYQLALTRLNQFHSKNRKIILDAISNKTISESQANQILNDILDDKSEILITEKVSNFLKDYKSYYEIFERRNEIYHKEREIENSIFSKFSIIQRFKKLVIFGSFIIGLFLMVFFGYDHLRAYLLYNQAYNAIANNQDQLGEDYFDLAFKRKIHPQQIIKIGDTYLFKKKYYEALEKYEQLLQKQPDNPDGIVALAHFYYSKKEYATSESILQKALVKNNLPQYQEALGEVYIHWGKKDPEKWKKAQSIFTDLFNANSKYLSTYLNKNLEIYSLQKEYAKAKFFFQTIQNEKRNKSPLNAYTVYFNFLQETYQNAKYTKNESVLNQKSIEKSEDAFIIKTLETELNKLANQYPKEAIVDYTKAKWLYLLEKKEKAIETAKSAIDKMDYLETEYPNLEKDLLFSLLGSFYFKRGDYTLAEENFKTSLEQNNQNRTANYFLGKLNLSQNNNYPLAERYFLASLVDTEKFDDQKKIDTVYSLGYLNYLRGKNQEELRKSEAVYATNYYQKALEYWYQLSDKVTNRNKYLIDYNISLAYLKLQRYDLSQVFLEMHLNELEKIFENYDQGKIQASIEVENRLNVLSDIYNNIGVAQIGRYMQKNRSSFLQNSLENFINSITLKDKLGLIKGTPYFNFNNINNYPKIVNRNELSPKEYINKRPFKIADNFIPTSLFPYTL